MKVDIYTITYNDIKLLPYFLRHYESFADRIFVWDDGSDDGTVEMLSSHPKVKILPHYIGRLDDLYFITHLFCQYRQHSRGYADWVICVDPDEFVYHTNILEKLEELKSRGINKVVCRGFHMFHPEFPTTQRQIYEEVKFGSYERIFSKPVLFDPSIEIKWTPGRHHCSKERFAAFDTGIVILHYRLLGYEFYIEKCISRIKRCPNMGPESIYRKRATATKEEFEKMGKDIIQVVN